MSLIIADRVKESTTTTGTGALTLSGAASSMFVAFSSKMSVGDNCYYVIEDLTNSAWEVGLGTYSAANTLTRTIILASSNAGAAVNLAAGTKYVWIDIAAAQISGENRDVIPQLANFSWLTQNGATATQQPYGISLVKPAGGLHSTLITPVPGSTWTATVRLKVGMPFDTSNSYGVGIARYDSATGKVVTFWSLAQSGGVGLQVINYSAPTTYASTAAGPYNCAVTPEWMRVRCDGTNFYHEISVDGDVWITLMTLAVSGNYSPATTSVGISMVTSSNAGYASLPVSLRSWKLA